MPGSDSTIYEQLSGEVPGNEKSIIAKLIRAQCVGETINITEAQKRLKKDLELVHIARSKWGSLTQEQLDRLGWDQSVHGGQRVKFITRFITINGPDELLDLLNEKPVPVLHWAKIKEGFLTNINAIKTGVEDKVKAISWHKRKMGVGTGGVTFKELMKTIEDLEGELNHFSLRSEFLSHFVCAFQSSFNSFATKKFLDKETSFQQRILHPHSYKRGEDLESIEECRQALLSTGFFREQASMVDNLIEIYRLSEIYLRQDVPGSKSILNQAELRELSELTNGSMEKTLDVFCENLPETFASISTAQSAILDSVLVAKEIRDFAQGRSNEQSSKSVISLAVKKGTERAIKSLQNNLSMKSVTSTVSKAAPGIPFVPALSKFYSLYYLMDTESSTKVLRDNLSLKSGARISTSYRKIMENVLDFAVWKKRITISQLVKIISTVLGTVICPAGLVISKIINIAINIAMKAIKYFLTLKNIGALENAIKGMPNKGRQGSQALMNHVRLERIASSKILSTFFIASTSSRQLINLRDTRFIRQEDFIKHTTAYRNLGLQTLDLTIARPVNIELQNELECYPADRLMYYGMKKGLT